MKKQILFTAFAIILSISSFSQWVYFAPGTNDNRVDIGNLAVTGHLITIEALITIQNSDPAPVVYDIVSKHFDGFDCNYLLRAQTFSIRTETGYKALAHAMPFCFDSTYHVAGTYDGDSMKYLINGVQVASFHWTGNLFQNGHTTGIGHMFSQSNHYEQFIGFIDEVRIWNVARSAADIAANMYDLPDPTSQTGLLGYYKFEGNYINVQGNPAYNGMAVGNQMVNTPNPYFNGSVSNYFCYPIGIDENSNSSSLLIYPNPTSGNFSIDISSLKHSKAHLTINNYIGEKVKEINLTTDKTVIEFNQPNGMYFLTVSTEREIYTAKIIVQR
ncbi:MAG: T9SS type A sorting domain-containing protein [Bacteroidales bacterium]|nr:T9SS type A sorting domain-containing protein [Bacteroidales bacterium]